MKRCDGCRFWRECRGHREIGECRVLSPVLVYDGRFVLDDREHVHKATHFPVTDAGCWCCKWEPVDNPPPTG